jgi:hypothetical protein
VKRYAFKSSRRCARTGCRFLYVHTVTENGEIKQEDILYAAPEPTELAVVPDSSLDLPTPSRLHAHPVS